jgi:hypothetical protein
LPQLGEELALALLAVSVGLPGVVLLLFAGLVVDLSDVFALLVPPAAQLCEALRAGQLLVGLRFDERANGADEAGHERTCCGCLTRRDRHFTGAENSRPNFYRPREKSAGSVSSTIEALDVAGVVQMRAEAELRARRRYPPAVG